MRPFNSEYVIVQSKPKKSPMADKAEAKIKVLYSRVPIIGVLRCSGLELDREGLIKL